MELTKIQPDFIQKIKQRFPYIKEIAHNNEIFKDGYTEIALYPCTDSSGTYVYFYNMTDYEFLNMIDSTFEKCSRNIKSYFNLLKFYNHFFYNINNDKFNVSINLIDNNSENNEIIFKIKAIMQTNAQQLFMFKDSYSIDNDKNIKDIEDDSKFTTYSLSLKNEAFVEYYQYAAKSLREDLDKYINTADVRSSNLQEYINLIQMIKI